MREVCVIRIRTTQLRVVSRPQTKPWTMGGPNDRGGWREVSRQGRRPGFKQLLFIKMKIGDLVKINIKPEDVAGTLTAVKYVGALERQYGGLIGIVIKIKYGYALIKFPIATKMIEEKFLEVISESG